MNLKNINPILHYNFLLEIRKIGLPERWNNGILKRFENLMIAYDKGFAVPFSTLPSFQYPLSAAWQAIQKF